MHRAGGRSPVSLALRTLALGLALSWAPAGADEWRLGGHVKYQLTQSLYAGDDVAAVFGDRSPGDHELDVRLKADKRSGAWDVSVHYEFLALAGDSLETRRSLAAALPGLVVGGRTGLPDDSRRLFDLTDESSEHARFAAVQRLDRLAVGYTTARGVLRIGRQAVSWGNGLVFHPLDIFNPFAPIAIDKDYKTGDDMVYGQWTLASGNDVQAIVLPRRDPATGRVDNEHGSYAAKFHGRGAGLDFDLLAARHYDEGLFGVGLVKSLGGAVGRLDVAVTDVRGEGHATSIVANLDYSWTALAKNMYGFVEYYRNGVGATEAAGYGLPAPALATRVARGEIFTLGRDYLAGGVQIELTPLFNLYNVAIANLDDGSGFLQLRGVYDWRQDLQVQAGVNLPFGGRGSEYGGVPVPGTGTYVAPARSFYVRAGYFF